MGKKHLKIRIKFLEKIISIKNHTPSKYATTDKYRWYLSVFKKNTDTDRYSVGIRSVFNTDGNSKKN